MPAGYKSQARQLFASSRLPLLAPLIFPHLRHAKHFRGVSRGGTGPAFVPERARACDVGLVQQPPQVQAAGGGLGQKEFTSNRSCSNNVVCLKSKRDKHP